MALLDLQAMETPIDELATKSDSSGHSCGASELSVVACGEHSVLSLAICHN
jgi:hypothetical protein